MRDLRVHEEIKRLAAVRGMKWVPNSKGESASRYVARSAAFDIDLVLWRKGDDDRPTVNSIDIRRAFKSRSSRDGALRGWLASCGIAMPAAGVQESFQRTSRDINGETLYFEYDEYKVDGNHKARITIQNEPIIFVE